MSQLASVPSSWHRAPETFILSEVARTLGTPLVLIFALDSMPNTGLLKPWQTSKWLRALGASVVLMSWPGVGFWMNCGWRLLTRTKTWSETWDFHSYLLSSRQGRLAGNGVNDWLCLYSRLALVVKNPPDNARDLGSIPGLGRSPGGGNGHPLQYPCLENPTDRGGWQATVPGVSQSQTWLKQLSTHACACKSP